MANRERGEVSIEIDGTVYTMCLSMNAMVALEELFSTAEHEVAFEEISTKADEGKVKYQRALLWAVLQDHHPEIKLTDVSRLVQAAGGFGAFTVKLIELAKLAAPDERDLARLGVKKNPPPAQGAAGRGGRSTSKGAAQA